jgi:hypothetical protein
MEYEYKDLPKQVLYDANKVKWIIEWVYNPKLCISNMAGFYVWIHVDGDNEEFSGEIAETYGEAFEQLIQGGYFYE